MTPFSFFASFYGYGVFISLLTTFSLLILSTIFLTFSKQGSQTPLEKSLQHIQKHSSEVEKPENGNITESSALNLKTAQDCSTPHVFEDDVVIADKKNENGIDEFQEYMVKSTDSYSESESNDHSFSSEEDYSDGSISDEESLIEIAIPGGHYKPQHHHLSHEESNMFKQHKFMDLLAEINEMNEEGNLIEIDISMGSIKYCSRFEIEA